MKSAIITGASSGIGAALALELGRRGLRVALLARRAAMLDKLAAEIEAGGGTALAIACDVTDSAAVCRAVEQVKSAWGSLDLAVANAGVGIATPAHRFPLADAERLMQVNYNGMLYLFSAVIGDMIAQKSGHFAGVASLAGIRGIPTNSGYSASKAAMQAFLEASRIDLRPHGVGVSIVNPGFVRTPMTDKHTYDMPFLMDADRAAVIVADGLLGRAREIDFPLPTTLAVRTARLLPNALYDWVMTKVAPKN
jgi:short-subunit dehydrogenase